MSVADDDLVERRPVSRVVVVGSLNLDHIVEVDRLPRSGATVSGDNYATAAGGKGLNQAVAAARQGAEVRMIGAIGEDAAGGLLADVLAREGIDTAGIVRRQGPSGTALITVAGDGSNTIVVAAGANGRLGVADIDPGLLEGAAVVLCQLEVPIETVGAALAAGRAAGALTVLNPAPVSAPLPAELMGLVDLIVPNETEADMLVPAAGGRRGSAARARAAGAALIAAGAGTAVITLGRRGAVVVAAGGTGRVEPFAVRAVDSTAAGDAFIGALVAARAGGEPMDGAARRAAAAGALATTRRGAVPSLPSRPEVDRLLGP